MQCSNLFWCSNSSCPLWRSQKSQVSHWRKHSTDLFAGSALLCQSMTGHVALMLVALQCPWCVCVCVRGETPAVCLRLFPAAPLVHSDTFSATNMPSKLNTSQERVTRYWYMPAMLDEGLHQGCNSPPVEMNQPLNAAPAPSPPAHFLTNIRGEKKRGICWFFFFAKIHSFLWHSKRFTLQVKVKPPVTLTGTICPVGPRLWD